MPTKIFVRGLDGNESMYEVELTDTVRKLKQKVFEREHLAVEDQRITYWDQLLLDSRTLLQHGISGGASICVKQESNEPMKIQVRVGAKSHVHEVRPKDTIGRLKEMIQSKDGIPVDEQRLTYGGQQLQDDKTLIECEIQKGTVVFVSHIKSAMQIYVRDEENGKSKTYEIKPTYTVGELKEKIQTLEKIPIDEQTLTHCGEEMCDNNRTLADYKVGRYATLRLTCDRMEIFVKALNGRTITLWVKLTTTVEELKEQIYEKLLLPIEGQYLTHCGKQLEDQHTMEHYGICKEAVIHQNGKMRLCPYKKTCGETERQICHRLSQICGQAPICHHGVPNG